MTLPVASPTENRLQKQQKVVCKTATGTPFAAWTLAKIERYAYDGWNMIMTVAYNGSFTGTPSTEHEVLTVGTVNGRVASYVWGPDIASRPDGHSSWQRAGGVGGLLMVVDGNGAWPGTPATTDVHFFPLMDRLGNVTGCRKAATGLPNDSLSAVLEYDAFGQEVRCTGPASDLVPFHFSTKFTDQESGLSYYGYRYYDPGKGRWLNRDPIGEEGGFTLYAILRNNCSTSVDVLGQAPFLDGTPKPSPTSMFIEFTLLEGKLAGLCDACEGACGSCSKQDCLIEAHSMARRLEREIGNILSAAIPEEAGPTDAVCGAMCDEWARFFEDVAKAGNPKCITTSKKGVRKSSQRRKFHVWLELKACGSEKAISLDTGFFGGGKTVHEGQPPVPRAPLWRPVNVR